MRITLEQKCTSWFEVQTGVESRGGGYFPWLQCGKCIVIRIIKSCYLIFLEQS